MRCGVLRMAFMFLRVGRRADWIGSRSPKEGAGRVPLRLSSRQRARSESPLAGLRGYFAAIIMLAFQAQGAEVYRWTDAAGQVHFGDRPPSEVRTETVDIRVNSYSGPPVVDIYEEFVAQSKRGDRRVVIYSTSRCGYCRQAKAYFKEHGIPYQEYDVEKSRRGRAEFDRLGGRGVPLILVGNQRMQGFDPGRFERLYRSALRR